MCEGFVLGYNLMSKFGCGYVLVSLCIRLRARSYYLFVSWCFAGSYDSLGNVCSLGTGPFVGYKFLV